MLVSQKIEKWWTCLTVFCLTHQSIQRSMRDISGPFQTVFKIKQSWGDLVDRKKSGKKFRVRRIVKSHPIHLQILKTIAFEILHWLFYIQSLKSKTLVATYYDEPLFVLMYDG